MPSYYSDKKVAAQLAKAGKSPGIVAPLNHSKIIHKLTSPVYTDVPITVSGSTWHWPEKVETLQINEPLIVFAEIEAHSSIAELFTRLFKTQKRIHIRVGDKNWHLASKAADPILLKREWERARIDKLLAMEDKTQNLAQKKVFHKPPEPPANDSVDVPPSDIADLEEFVANFKKEAKSKAFIIDPFPVGCTFPFYYEANGRRDPFTPFESDEEKETDTSAPYDEPTNLVRFLQLVREMEAASSSQLAPWSGHYAEFRALLEQADFKAAGKLAQQWRQEDKASVMALIALGEWYEKTGHTSQAARAYGSLIDYFPARADIRRWAAERLLAIKSANWLSIDSLKKAAKQRPDHPSGHYLLAIAYWEAKQYQAAVETLQAALRREFPRFATAKRILTETLALMLTHLQQQLKILFPGKTFNWEKISQRQLRLALMWETDTNNVNLHIYDNELHHADGTLYANITTGYGPEYFKISEPQAFPYKIQVHYANRGPMGYGMGVLHILNYAQKMGLRSEFRPFVVMKKGAFVELGEINK